MGLLRRYRAAKVRKRFEQVGEGCSITPHGLEVKGHVHLGKGVVLRSNIIMRTHKRGRIELGDDVEVGDYTLFIADDFVRVGKGSFVGPHCVLRDTNHTFQGSDVHWRLLPHISQGITIGEGCYVGARCYIMPGVRVGDGAVIAPASIVTKDVGPNEIWAGAPVARMVAHRTDPAKRSKLKRDLALVAAFGVETGDPED